MPQYQVGWNKPFQGMEGRRINHFEAEEAIAVMTHDSEKVLRELGYDVKTSRGVWNVYDGILITNKPLDKHTQDILQQRVFGNYVESPSITEMSSEEIEAYKRMEKKFKNN